MYSSRKLLVEGPVDQRVISALSEKFGLRLKLGPESYLVEIKPFDGVSQLLDPAVLRAEARASELQILGIAFQDEPGRQLHEAVINRLLDLDHEMSRKFFSWFCRLFELTPTSPESRQ